MRKAVFLDENTLPESQLQRCIEYIESTTDICVMRLQSTAVFFDENTLPESQLQRCKEYIESTTDICVLRLKSTAVCCICPAI
jgi:hypothetical protein